MRGAHSIDAHQEVGRRLASIRVELGLTQRELGRALGRPQSYVAKIELGERRLDVLDMAAFAQAFGLQPAELASRLRLIELGNAVSCDGGR